MHRVLFRIGALSAALVVGGTAFAAAGATDAAIPTVAATEAANPEDCRIINGVWYCWPWPDFAGDKS